MEELKIVIEKIASILLKTFINFCKATEIDVEELLGNLSKD